MARHDDLDNPIKYSDAWDGMTGSQVEDAITGAIDELHGLDIENVTYEDLKLSLWKKDGTSINVDVTVTPPDYAYGIYIYALRVNGTKYEGSTLEQIILYNAGKKFEVGIAAYATSTVNGNVTQRNISLPVELTYGKKSTTINVATISSEYFNLDDSNAVRGINVPEDGNIDSIVKWIDISTLFTETCNNGTLTATLIPDKEDKTSILTYTLSTPITIQVISLSYSGSFYTNSQSISFTLKGGNASNYKLDGTNSGADVSVGDGLTAILHSGLNQLVVKAALKANTSICTDYYYLDIICTLDCEDTVIAINKVADGISNNAIATLYDLTVYSPKKETTTISTYFSEISPYGTPEPSANELLKTQTLTRDDYNSDFIFNTAYYKYIENLNNKETYRYLMVKVGDNSWYTFFTEALYGTIQLAPYRTMVLNAVTEEYCYYRSNDIAYNFDQINGRNNNVFITKEYADSVGIAANISDDIEVTDGWAEDAGVLYFKISAQDQTICTLSNLNLGNEFTLETKFKTYNVSDATKPILTFGNILLLPTQLAYKGDTDKRNSIFRKDTIIHLMVTVKRNFTISSSDPYYPDYMTTDAGYNNSFQLNFDKEMSSTSSTSNKFNLVRVFINGCIDREYILSDDEFNELKTSSIIINPTTSDVNFYLLRLYNQTALEFSQVQLNYISSLTNDVSKEDDNPKKAFYDKNDLLGDNDTISFTKAYLKYNTILLVFPKDPVSSERTNYVPTRAWGGKDNSDPHPNDYLPVTLFINYSDETKNKKYGGRLTNTRVRGQGTSAMRYWIWNVATHITKAKKYTTNEDGSINTATTEKAKSTFTPYSNLDTKTNTFVDNPVNVLKKYYLMPGDDETKVTKAVGKVNYASSMQNHKLGATDLYNAFYKALVSDFKIGGTSLGGYKAVKEEPFLYFYTYADEYDVSNWELADVLEADSNNKVKFMGFMTWGSGKGDNETFAIDSNRTPGYLFLEGGENGDAAVQFRVPWQGLQRNKVSWVGYNDPTHIAKLEDDPQISYEDSLEKPWENLYISGDESIIYDPVSADVTGAWDVDNGLEELDNGEFRLDVGSDEAPNKYLRQSIKTWREFYDFVYTHDWDIVFTSEQDTSKWDITRKVCCTASSIPNSFDDHVRNDVYRYDTATKKWVKAGVKYIYDSNNSTNNGWEAYNLLTATGTTDINTAIQKLRQDFYDNIAYKESDPNNSGTLDAIDANIHQALIRLLSGTDNRAKNTYFRVVGPIMTETPVMEDGVLKVDENGDPVTTWVEPEDYEGNERKYHFVGFLQDDMDTVLATDNNGLQTKEYNLLEPSYYNPDDSTEVVNIKKWGDNGKNVFFRCYDQAFEENIINTLNQLIDFAFNGSKTVTDSSNRFYKYFFEPLNSMFPAIAFNHTAKIYYELGQLVLNTKAISEFGSNDENPIEQSHGSCIESELSFMDKRLRFLGTLAKNADSKNILNLNAGSGSGGGVSEINMLLTYKVAQDLYPNYRTLAYDYLHTRGNDVGFFKSTDIVNPNYKPYLNSIARNRLAVANEENNPITLKLASSINNSINQMDMYSYLELKGYQGDSLGSADYSSLLEINVDNDNRGDFPEMAFTKVGWKPNFPVAKKITFANMQLPDSLNFEDCSKLQELNLSGSKINVVYLPKTSHLTTVTLPATITYFGISNAPNLSNVTFEGLDNLETVDINCDKASKFDISDFCEQLINCPNLKSVTLTNLNHSISLNALETLISVGATLTGKLTIVDSSNLLVAISYSNKVGLAELYGNIDSEDNALYVSYATSIATVLSCEAEVSVYGENYVGNPFGVSLNGNNFSLTTTDDGKVIPAITYQFNSSISDVATIDSKTGVITMKVTSSPKTTTATISVELKNGKILKSNINVNFAWKAPALGNFVYADGTYSNAYMENKTLMGIIFALGTNPDPDDENDKIAYILGKEYLEEQYVGYENDGYNNTSISILNYLYKVKTCLDKISSGLGSSYLNVENAPSEIDADNNNTLAINVTNFKLKNPSTFSGKDDTKVYVNHVNKNLLPYISTYIKKEGYKSDIENYITVENNNYYIASMDNLNNMLDEIKTIVDGKTSYDITKCILFPYFYETYLYEPEATETEKATDAFNNNFSQGNWYIPSFYELATLIYYRGYSVEGGDFTAFRTVLGNISADITNGGTDLTNPIFSTALKNMGLAKFPNAWKNLADTNNLCTMTASGSGNYSYQTYEEWQSSTSSNIKAEWMTGKYVADNYGYGINTVLQNAWRLTQHRPLPCVQFKYKEQL